MTGDLLEQLALAGELLDDQGTAAVDARLVRGHDGPELVTVLGPPAEPSRPRRMEWSVAAVVLIVMATGLALLAGPWAADDPASDASWVSLVPPPGLLDQVRGPERSTEGPESDPLPSMALVVPAGGGSLERSVRITVREPLPDDDLSTHVSGFPHPVATDANPFGGFRQLDFQVSQPTGPLVVSVKGSYAEYDANDLLELARRIDPTRSLADLDLGPEWRLAAIHDADATRAVRHAWSLRSTGHVAAVALHYVVGVDAPQLVDLLGEPYRAVPAEVGGQPGWAHLWGGNVNGQVLTLVWSPEPNAVASLTAVVGGGEAISEAVGYAEQLVPVDRDGWQTFVDSLPQAGRPDPDSAATERTTSHELTRVDWDAIDHPVDCAGVGTRGSLLVVAEPAEDEALAVVGVSCRAGAGTPPWAVFTFDNPTVNGPRLRQVLLELEENWSFVPSDARTDGSLLVIEAYGYSGHDVPRCCPDVHGALTWEWVDGRFERVGVWPESVHLTAP